MNTLNYAKSELLKYWKKVTGEEECNIELINENYGNSLDDVAVISVKEGKGNITASNERSLLLGVYRFFYYLGCRYIRPGKNGDLIVKKTAKDCTVNQKFSPDKRHRGVCNEGVVSRENIIDMVEWIPKIGMNTYFMQFTDGHLFFEKWYRHLDSSVLEPEKYSVEKSKEHYKEVVKAIKKCGLVFHAVGHGWTTEPLGYVTYGEKRAVDSDILPEHRELFALVDGKRGFYRNTPSDTHLCYSNKKAREIVVDSMVDYLKVNKNTVDVLHFWLADSINNHCECDNCKNTLPADFYVMMLNELDSKLIENNINTKIVFLIYCDLLWAPENNTIKNPERFILMYAPIARNYFNSLYSRKNINSTDGEKAPLYIRNKNTHPKNESQYLHHLNNWLEKVDCDSFTFEYHLMIFAYGADLSFMRVSKTIYEDMIALKNFNINGNISCQLQRVFFPTSLPMYVMGETLMSTGRKFEEIVEEYMTSSFGKFKDKAEEFLIETEKFFLSDCIRGKLAKEQRLGTLEAFKKYLDDFSCKVVFSPENKVETISLELFKFFIIVIQKLIVALQDKALGTDIDAIRAELFNFLDKNENEYQPYLDTWFFKEGIKSWL